MKTTVLHAFKTEPKKHQLLYFQNRRDKVWDPILADMGTGKSKIVIDNMAYLYEQGLIDSAVIVAPTGNYRDWTDFEIPIHMPDSVKYRAACWVSNGKREDKDVFDEMIFSDNVLQILCINTEMLSLAKGFKIVESFMEDRLATFMAVDESTSIKEPTSNRTKNIIKLGRKAQYRRILTGTASANSPLNLYSQFDFLEHGALGHESFASFRGEYADAILKKELQGRMLSLEEFLSPKDLTPAERDVRRRMWLRKKGRSYVQINGYRNQEKLQTLVSSLSFIVKKEDVLDLPPKYYAEPLEVRMTDTQAQAYRDMKNQSMIDIGYLLKRVDTAGARSTSRVTLEDLLASSEERESLEEPNTEPDEGLTVTAQIVITRLLRLHQIACGFTKTDDGRERPIDSHSNPRIDALKAKIKSFGSHEKVIVWATYRWNIQEIVSTLSNTYGAQSVVHYYGGTRPDDRYEAKLRFQGAPEMRNRRTYRVQPAIPHDPQCRFFVGNPRTAGYGLTLTKATRVLYFSNGYDLEERLQSEDRCHRIGQTERVEYTDLVVPGTVDEKIVEALRGKKKLSDMITASNWKDFLV